MFYNRGTSPAIKSREKKNINEAQNKNQVNRKTAAPISINYLTTAAGQ